ncbi:hydrolase, NUDIX family protein [Besnoitia besnoiti]|uniref:Hydrolase, NUDIX family protein n=1 Tax=Besnoitia besnoiti TaxID=94643 RepID=A0A2A9MI16_BESBE|nr:hydrolase, NUDIX family protein [Besnoitia besnoiti]PFH35042.1 hydrolase, NUDIX family protein [Besnoitia besnoiti]
MSSAGQSLLALLRPSRKANGTCTAATQESHGARFPLPPGDGGVSGRLDASGSCSSATLSLLPGLASAQGAEGHAEKAREENHAWKEGMSGTGFRVSSDSCTSSPGYVSAYYGYAARRAEEALRSAAAAQPGVCSAGKQGHQEAGKTRASSSSCPSTSCAALAGGDVSRGNVSIAGVTYVSAEVTGQRHASSLSLSSANSSVSSGVRTAQQGWLAPRGLADPAILSSHVSTSVSGTTFTSTTQETSLRQPASSAPTYFSHRPAVEVATSSSFPRTAASEERTDAAPAFSHTPSSVPIPQFSCAAASLLARKDASSGRFAADRALPASSRGPFSAANLTQYSAASPASDGMERSKVPLELDEAAPSAGTEASHSASISNTTRALLAALSVSKPALASRSRRDETSVLNAGSAPSGAIGLPGPSAPADPAAGGKTSFPFAVSAQTPQVSAASVCERSRFVVACQQNAAGFPEAFPGALPENKWQVEHGQERRHLSGGGDASRCLDSRTSAGGVQGGMEVPLSNEDRAREHVLSFSSSVSCVTSRVTARSTLSPPPRPDAASIALGGRDVSPPSTVASGAVSGLRWAQQQVFGAFPSPLLHEGSANRGGRREDRGAAGAGEDDGEEKRRDDRRDKEKKKRKKDRENEEKKEREAAPGGDVNGSSTSVNGTAGPGGGGNEASNVTSEREKAVSIKEKCRDPDLLDEALLDCYGRFITLLPDAFLRDRIHLYFQIQEAFWWYDDIWWEKHADRLPKLTLKDFGCLICHDCPILQHYIPPEKHDKFLANWKRYCRTIPLRGAIILNEDLSKCLMVTGWKGGTWMFPRGKVDEGEQDAVCACREIWEEIGVDISPYIDEEVYVEHVLEEQPIKLFIIPGIKETVNFQPLKRKEIGRIGWIDTWRLPSWHLSPLTPPGPNTALNLEQQKHLRTWQVEPFIPALRGWVELLKHSGRRLTVSPSACGSPAATSTRKTYGESPEASSAALQKLRASSPSACIAGCFYQVAPDVPRHVIEHLQDAARAFPCAAVSSSAGLLAKPVGVSRASPSPQKAPFVVGGLQYCDAFQAATHVSRPPQRQIGTLPWSGSATTAAGAGGGKARQQPQQSRAGVGQAPLGVSTPPIAWGAAPYGPEDVGSQTEQEGNFDYGCQVGGSSGFSGYSLPVAGRGRGHLMMGMRLREVGIRSFDDQDVERRRALQQRTCGFSPSNAFASGNEDCWPSSSKPTKNALRQGESLSGEPGIAGAGSGSQKGHQASPSSGNKKAGGASGGGESRDAPSGGPASSLHLATPSRKQVTSLDDMGVTYHMNGAYKEGGDKAGGASAKKTRAWGKDKCNNSTFGGGHGGGWSVEEMFRFNEENFGVVSTYDIESYTVPLPKKRVSPQTAAAASAATGQSPSSDTPSKAKPALREIGVAGAAARGGRSKEACSGAECSAIAAVGRESAETRTGGRAKEEETAAVREPHIDAGDPTRACRAEELQSDRHSQASAALLGLLKAGGANRAVTPRRAANDGKGKADRAGRGKPAAGAEGAAPVGASEATRVSPSAGREDGAGRDAGAVVVKGPFVFDAFLQKVKEEQQKRAGVAAEDSPGLVRGIVGSRGVKLSDQTAEGNEWEAGQEETPVDGDSGTAGSLPKTPWSVTPPQYVAEKRRRQQEAGKAIDSLPSAPYIHSIDPTCYMSEGPALGRLARTANPERPLLSPEGAVHGGELKGGARGREEREEGLSELATPASGLDDADDAPQRRVLPGGPGSGGGPSAPVFDTAPETGVELKEGEGRRPRGKGAASKQGVSGQSHQGRPRERADERDERGQAPQKGGGGAGRRGTGKDADTKPRPESPQQEADGAESSAKREKKLRRGGQSKRAGGSRSQDAGAAREADSEKTKGVEDSDSQEEPASTQGHSILGNLKRLGRDAPAGMGGGGQAPANRKGRIAQTSNGKPKKSEEPALGVNENVSLHRILEHLDLNASSDRPGAACRAGVWESLGTAGARLTRRARRHSAHARVGAQCVAAEFLG